MGEVFDAFFALLGTQRATEVSIPGRMCATGGMARNGAHVCDTGAQHIHAKTSGMARERRCASGVVDHRQMINHPTAPSITHLPSAWSRPLSRCPPHFYFYFTVSVVTIPQLSREASLTYHWHNNYDAHGHR